VTIERRYKRHWADGHVARQARPVNEFITKLVIARTSRDDAAGLVPQPAGLGLLRILLISEG